MEDHLVNPSRAAEMQPHPLGQMFILTADPAIGVRLTGNEWSVKRAYTPFADHPAVAKAVRTNGNLHTRFIPKSDVSIAAGSGICRIGSLRSHDASHHQESQESCCH